MQAWRRSLFIGPWMRRWVGCVTSDMTLLCKLEATPFMRQGECLD